MNDFKDKLYSDNLHNYDYDELVEDLIEQDIENLSSKYKNLNKSYTCCPR